MLKKEEILVLQQETKNGEPQNGKSGVVPFLPVLFLVSNWHHVHKLQTSIYSLQHFETLSPMHLESKEKPLKLFSRNVFL